MKGLLTCLIASVLLFVTLFLGGAHAAPTLDDLRLSVTFAPPHNEPVIGSYVARYRTELHGTVSWGPVEWTPRLTLWGVNTWRNSATVGHFPDSWGNSDWSIEHYRLSTTQQIKLRATDHLAVFAEHYLPFQNERWGGHGLERHYYWLTGIEWRLK